MTQAQLKQVETLTLYAQPYDLDAHGFYFDSFEDYQAKYNKNCNVYGQPVEEYMIDFIDGSAIDCDLFKAVKGQYNLKAFFMVANTWEEYQKIPLIIAYEENITSEPFNEEVTSDMFEDIDIYYDMSFEDLAWQFIEDGLFGDISEDLKQWLDIGKMALSLSYDYNEITVGNNSIIYRSM
jgi:hypothetical protein